MSTHPQTRLTDGRLATRPSALLVEHVTDIELSDELEQARDFVHIDLAHTLMLTEQGIFSAGQGRIIVEALLQLLEADPAAELDGDPETGTITLQIERYLERTCGPLGLDIQRARSRIDQNATGLRMADRQGLLRVTRQLLTLCEVLLQASTDYDDVLVPGYTHLQHAQPTTLGHYFNAHYWTTARNVRRLLDTFARLNECPLGGAAHSGTSWPIDRALTAAYLGFDRPIPNARDAGMSATDIGAELASALGLTLSGMSRCASDLYFWSSSEVGLLQLHPSLCGTSSMMPQKRNPIALERIRALAGEAAGWTASQLGVLHFATSTDADQGYVHNRLPGYCDETAGAIGLLCEAVATLEVDVEAMAFSAGKHWSTSSALADELVLSHGLSYRAAHDVVARWVRGQERAQRETSGHLVPDPSNGATIEEISPERLSTLLDPHAFVESRRSAGGTASGQRRELHERATSDLHTLLTAVAGIEEQLSGGQALLMDDAHQLLGHDRSRSRRGRDLEPHPADGAQAERS